MAPVELQSADHRNLLDIIDKLRSKGISRYVDLPEIIVCGEQSAGKSSVLEAISGMSFNTKDTICTRFATELVLRRQDIPAVKVSIHPGPERSAHDRKILRNFGVKLNLDKPDIGGVVEEAKAAMGLSDTKNFSTDILRVELCGPTQPHLTLVDLPGLFRASNREKSVQDAIVQKLVRDYVKRPRSIIVAVISAKSDFALQEITELARELDLKGMRTLGLITKPDALDAGSDSEASYVRLSKNKDVVFRLGWHVLKNRDYQMRNTSSLERDEAEEKYFAEGIWATMNPNHIGVKSLKPRLSNVLKDEILLQLPSLLHDVESEIETCNAQLQRLGTPRRTLLEQRRYLLHVSREFTTLMKAAVDGEYNNVFFGSAKTAEGYRKRLRARIQNSLADFGREMQMNGQNRIIIDDCPGQERKLPGNRIWRSDYLDEVIDLMRRSRARELPGILNPLIIGQLFADQCQPWRGIADNIEEEVLRIVYDIAEAIVDHVAVDDTTRGILYLVNSGIDALKTELSSKLREILRPHSESHPITYNHYLTDTVQQRQAQRSRRKLEEAFKDIVGRERFDSNEVSITPISVLNLLKSKVEVDMERSAGELAVDYMLAYYQVALKKFVDDISVLAVEQCLVSKLPNLFQAEMVLDLEDEEISHLVGETAAMSTERARCTETLEVLEAGKADLRRHSPHRSLDIVPRSGKGNIREVVASRDRAETSAPRRASPAPSSSATLDRRTQSDAEDVAYEALAVEADEGAVEFVTESFPLDEEPLEPAPEPEPEPEPESADGGYFMSYEVKKKTRRTIAMSKEFGDSAGEPPEELSIEPPEPPAGSFWDSLKSKEVKKKGKKNKRRVSQPLEEVVAEEPLPEVSFVGDVPAEEAVAEECAEEPQPEVVCAPECEPEPEPVACDPEPEPAPEVADGDYSMTNEVKKKAKKMKRSKEFAHSVEAPEMKTSEVRKKKGSKKHIAPQPLEQVAGEAPLPGDSFVAEVPAEEPQPEPACAPDCEPEPEPEPLVCEPEPEPEPVAEYGFWGSISTAKKKKAKSGWFDEPMPEPSAEVEPAPEEDAEAEKPYDPWNWGR